MKPRNRSSHSRQRSSPIITSREVDVDPAGAVEVYPASSLFRQGTEVPAIQRGNLEMSVMTGPIGEQLAADVAEQAGIEILAVAYLGTRQVNLREARDVTGPGDLNGLKLRMPATPEWLLLGETLGVEPAPLAMPEVYVALQTGAVDGQENPLTITNAARFYEVTQQVVLTSHLVQPVFYAISKPFFDGLTGEQQALLRKAAQAGAALGNAGRYGDEQTVVSRLAEEHGLRVDAIDLAAFRAHADEVYADAPLAADWNADLLRQVAAQ